MSLSPAIDEMLAPWIESNSLVSKSVSRKEVLLNSGYKMPVIGLGTWTQDDKTVEMSVYEAIKDGYRLIDTRHFWRLSFLIYSKNRLETKHFKTISVCVAPNGVQTRVLLPEGV